VPASAGNLLYQPTVLREVFAASDAPPGLSGPLPANLPLQMARPRRREHWFTARK
jgi:hypothetical protein